MNRDNVLIALAEREVLCAADNYQSVCYETTTDFFLESEKKTIFTKLKEFFQRLIQSIVSFFTGKTAKRVEEQLENASKDPTIKNGRVTMKDTTKLEKLDDDTLEKLKDPKTNTTKLLEKYHKRRNAILATLGTVTITVSGLFGLYKLLGKKGKKILENTEKTSNQIINMHINHNGYNIRSVRTPKLKHSSTKVKTKRNSNSSNVSINETAAAVMEVAKNKKNTVLMKHKLIVEAYRDQIEHMNGKYGKAVKGTKVVRYDTQKSNDLFSQYKNASKNNGNRKKANEEMQKLHRAWRSASGEYSDGYKKYIKRGLQNGNVRTIEMQNEMMKSRYDENRKKRGLTPDSKTRFNNYV